MQSKLNTEYARYQLSQKIKNIANGPCYDDIVNSILYLMAFKNDTTRSDPIFLDLSKTDSIYGSLYNLIKYSSKTYDEVSLIISKIHQAIKSFLSVKTHPKVEYKIKDNHYSCGSISHVFEKDHLKKLLSKSEPIHLLITWVRYQSLGSYYLDSMIPEFYQQLKSKNINSVISLGHPFGDYGGLSYTSLFYDLDKNYGSKGFISKYQPEKSEIMIYIIPLIPILKNIIIAKLHETKTSYLLVLPKASSVEYQNTIYFKKLISTKNIKHFKVPINKDITVVNDFLHTQKIKYQIINFRHLIFPSDLLSSKHIQTMTYNLLKFLSKNTFDIEINPKYKDQIDLEYKRYMFIESLKKISKGYEWGNILERFVISMANVKITKKKDVIFINVPENHYIYKQMRRELSEKKIKNIDVIIKTIRSRIEKFLEDTKVKNIDSRNSGQVILNNKLCVIYYNDFKKKLNRRRFISLIKNCTEPENYLELLTISLIRHECMNPRGQTWNLPHRWYHYLYQTYNVSLEGFSNPFNSQLLTISPNPFFGSLYHDTDKYFGSIGNIFELNILDFKKSVPLKDGVLTIVLNPPYILSLMTSMITWIKKWISSVPSIRIIVGFPYWEDVELIQELKKYKYTKSSQVLNIGDYYYENSLDPCIPNIYHLGSYQLFIIDNLPEQNYQEVYENIKPIYNEIL